MSDSLTAKEWLASFTGLLGAGLLAGNAVWSGWGFVSFFISNVLWMLVATERRYWPLVSMQIGFFFTSVVGIYRWFFSLP